MRLHCFVVFVGALSAGCGGKVVVEAVDDASTDASAPAKDSTAPLPDGFVGVDTGATRDTFVAVDTRPDPPPETCPDCVTRDCRLPVEACMADPRCKAALDCLNYCPVGGPSDARTTCLNTCVSDAAGAVDDVVVCVVAYCKRPCAF